MSISDLKRKKSFTRIYDKNLWGGGKGEIYSGEGSHREDLINPYLEFVDEFIAKNNINSIVEIGVGDFNVAKHYAYSVEEFYGIDIVRRVVDANNQLHSKEGVSFLLGDVVTGENLVNADLCICRQVLQHLTNAEIIMALNNMKKYRHVIITEHVYKKSKATAYNIDIHKSRVTRRNYFSGVYLEEEPFNINCEIGMSIEYAANEDLLVYCINNDI